MKLILDTFNVTLKVQLVMLCCKKNSFVQCVTSYCVFYIILTTSKLGWVIAFEITQLLCHISR